MTRHRQVIGLKWALARDTGPGFSPNRSRGAKAAGRRYERALARAVPAADSGRWFEFQDINGHGWCQTDLLVDLGDEIVCLEAKYTWLESGHTQIEQLYRPVVEHVLRKPCLGVVVCKLLLPAMRGVEVSATVTDALAASRRGRRSVLHWLGVSALGPWSRSGSAAPLDSASPSSLGL